MAALQEFGLLNSANMDESKKAAIKYVLSASQEPTTATLGFDLAALDAMGLFDSLTLTGAQRQSLNTIVALSQGQVDASTIQSSLFSELGLI